MRVKALRIDRHGPLTEFSRKHFGDFTLVHGPNEHGKTLIIDALIKMLFRKEFTKVAKHLGNIQRVTEPPDGYVVLESKGSQVSIAQGESISDHFDIDAKSFRNIFVVRDSDLAIVDDVKFYAQLSERLAGLKTSEIDRIKRILQQKGRLTNATANSDLSKAATADHAGRRVESALRLIADIEGKMKFFLNSDFDRLERRLVETQEHIARMRTELDMLKDAEARERFDKCRKDLDELRWTDDKLRLLSRVSEGGLENWKQFDFEVSRLQSEIDAGEQQRLSNDERLQKINMDYARVRARLTELEARHRQVESEFEPEVEQYLALSRTGRRRKSRASMWRVGSIAGLVLLAISMVGSVVHLSAFFYGASAVSLGLLVLSVSRLVRLRRTEWRVRESLEALRATAKRFDLVIDDAEDLSHLQNPFARELDAERVKLDELEIARRALGNQQSELSQATGRKRQRLQETQDKIKDLALQSGVANVDSYRATLETRRELNSRLTTLQALLANELGSAQPEAMVDVWEQALEERTPAAAEDGYDLPFDAARVHMLEREIENKQVLVGETEEALNLGRRELRDLELKVTQSGILRDREVECRSTRDLDDLAEALRGFVRDMQQDADNAKAAIQLFERIEVEEKLRLVELFGAGKPVSSYFKTMTDGLYEEVRFDTTTNEITVLTGDNVVLEAEQLSGGAIDQLYLAIRIAIAERLVVEPGFFILDDPFIKADFQRVKTQMTVLRRLVQMGWQILYFSAKKEVLDVLAEDIRSGRVDLIQLDERLDHAPPAAREATEIPKAPYSADLFPDQ